MTAALGGALLLSALVAQARGPGGLDADPPAPNPPVATPDAGAPADGPSAGRSRRCRGPRPPPALAGDAGISTQALPPRRRPAPEQKPADVNKPVGIGSRRTTTRDSCWSRRRTRLRCRICCKLNHVSQFKYTNTLAVHSTYVTHLGEVKDVNKRNDFQLTRDVFYFSGYVFDKRLDYNIILYTSIGRL